GPPQSGSVKACGVRRTIPPSLPATIASSLNRTHPAPYTVSSDMGFEQLAALRDQLAAEAAKNKRPANQSSSGKDKALRPSQADKPAKAKPQGKNRQAPTPRREPQPQVEPVVLNISRLQRQYPKAFPKRPEPKVPLKLGIHNDLYAQS